MSYDTFGQKDAMQQHAGIVTPHTPETKRKAARTVALNVPAEELPTILAMLGLDEELPPRAIPTRPPQPEYLRGELP